MRVLASVHCFFFCILVRSPLSVLVQVQRFPKKQLPSHLLRTLLKVLDLESDPEKDAQDSAAAAEALLKTLDAVVRSLGIVYDRHGEHPPLAVAIQLLLLGDSGTAALTCYALKVRCSSVLASFYCLSGTSQ